MSRNTLNLVDRKSARLTIDSSISQPNGASIMSQLINTNPTSIHSVYLRLIVSCGAGV